MSVGLSGDQSTINACGPQSSDFPERTRSSWRRVLYWKELSQLREMLLFGGGPTDPVGRGPRPPACPPALHPSATATLLIPMVVVTKALSLSNAEVGKVRPGCAWVSLLALVDFSGASRLHICSEKRQSYPLRPCSPCLHL